MFVDENGNLHHSAEILLEKYIQIFSPHLQLMQSLTGAKGTEDFTGDFQTEGLLFWPLIQCQIKNKKKEAALRQELHMKALFKA